MRNKYIAAIIAFFFGYLGAHKFYLGKHGQGILYLIFFCISWIPALIDMVILLAMSDDDFDAKYNLSTEGLLLHKERMELEREKLKIQKLRLQRERIEVERKLHNYKNTELSSGQADELAAWNSLMDQGLISKEEYEEKRKIILGLDDF